MDTRRLVLFCAVALTALAAPAQTPMAPPAPAPPAPVPAPVAAPAKPSGGALSDVVRLAENDGKTTFPSFTLDGTQHPVDYNSVVNVDVSFSQPSADDIARAGAADPLVTASAQL